MVSPLIKLQGKSGCKIEVINNTDRLYLKKTSANISYNLRLEAQAKKQLTFSTVGSFLTPALYDVVSGGSLALSYINMEYVWAEKFSEFFQTCNLAEVDSLIDRFILYFDSIISRSTVDLDPTTLLLTKLETLLTTSVLNPLTVSSIKTFVSRLPVVKIPSGVCHGDLTLSNVLLTKDKVYLIDFLDSYIEAPIIDMVKLRQDSKFYWSVLIDNDLTNNKITRTLQILKYFDSRLEAYYLTYNWYTAWYKYFELINLLRVLPYLTAQVEQDFIVNLINDILTRLCN
jgi:serine/threonine protein kinase